MGTAPAKVPHVERRKDSQKMLPSNKTQINEYERRERERKEGKERRREGRKKGRGRVEQGGTENVLFSTQKQDPQPHNPCLE